jgi:hypothetical protein
LQRPLEAVGSGESKHKNQVQRQLASGLCSFQGGNVDLRAPDLNNTTIPISHTVKNLDGITRAHPQDMAHVMSLVGG